jgi:hypothetical protein
MNPEVVALVQNSWAKVTPIASQAAALFYSNLFTLDPSLKPLFQGDMEEQGRRLMDMIGTAVQKLDNVETVVPVLQSLRKRHVQVWGERGTLQNGWDCLVDNSVARIRRAFYPASERGLDTCAQCNGRRYDQSRSS